MRTLAAYDSVLLSSVTFTGTSPLSRYFNSSRSLLGGNYPTFTQEWHALKITQHNNALYVRGVEETKCH